MWIHRWASYRCILYMSLLYLFNPLKALLSAAETPVEEKLGFKKTAGSAGWEAGWCCTFEAELGGQIQNSWPPRAQQPRMNLGRQGSLSKSKAPSSTWGSFTGFIKVVGVIFQAMSQYSCNIGPPLLMVPGELRRRTGASTGRFQFSPPKKLFQGV